MCLLLSKNIYLSVSNVLVVIKEYIFIRFKMCLLLSRNIYLLTHKLPLFFCKYFVPLYSHVNLFVPTENTYIILPRLSASKCVCCYQRIYIYPLQNVLVVIKEYFVIANSRYISQLVGFSVKFCNCIGR